MDNYSDNGGKPYAYRVLHSYEGIPYGIATYSHSTGRDRYSNANAAWRCADEHPDCDGYPNGQRCNLHAHRIPWRSRRSSGGAQSR